MSWLGEWKKCIFIFASSKLFWQKRSNWQTFANAKSFYTKIKFVSCFGKSKINFLILNLNSALQNIHVELSNSMFLLLIITIIFHFDQLISSTCYILSNTESADAKREKTTNNSLLCVDNNLACKKNVWHFFRFASWLNFRQCYVNNKNFVASHPKQGKPTNVTHFFDKQQSPTQRLNSDGCLFYNKYFIVDYCKSLVVSV